ncbi:RHS repeat-associated core domain-containing protein [Microbulbifer discodermiae]|uniref:RHS repeat-associated core domain-containing protein n=1 Tax=Microbulbifer sp. 2201CG32-9 TaxID=3232309 RepID=UPI00345BB969
MVLDGSGASISGEGMSFDPWGQRRDSSWQQIDISALVATDYSLLDTLTDTTTRGFTGHEMVDALGIIHMNGRIYDPALGRFLQADPMIDGVMDTQGYNRYSYVKGNPLTLTDPTGYYSWGDFRKDWKEFWKDRSVGVSVGSNGVGVYGGDPNPDHQGFWAPLGGAGAALPEGSSSGAFGSSNSEGIPVLAYASSGTVYNGGGYDGFIAEETSIYLNILQSDDAINKEPKTVSDLFIPNKKIKSKFREVEHGDGLIEHIFDLTYENQSSISDAIIDSWAKQIEEGFTQKFGDRNKLTVVLNKLDGCDTMCRALGGGADIVFSSVSASLHWKNGGCPPNSAACAEVGSGEIRFVTERFANAEFRADTASHEFAHAIGFYHDWNSTGSIRSYAKSRSLMLKDYQKLVEYYGD